MSGKKSEQKQVGFLMPEEQYEKFKKEIDKMGMSEASMMKFLIAEFLHKRGVR